MTHLDDRFEEHSPKPEGVSAKVAPVDEIQIKTPVEVCGMGHRMKRKEDPRFHPGQGQLRRRREAARHALHGYRAQPARTREDRLDRRQ